MEYLALASLALFLGIWGGINTHIAGALERIGRNLIDVS
jgi:hypothetical protein